MLESNYHPDATHVSLSNFSNASLDSFSLSRPPTDQMDIQIVETVRMWLENLKPNAPEAVSYNGGDGDDAFRTKDVPTTGSSDYRQPNHLQFTSSGTDDQADAEASQPVNNPIPAPNPQLDELSASPASSSKADARRSSDLLDIPSSSKADQDALHPPSFSELTPSQAPQDTDHPSASPTTKPVLSKYELDSLEYLVKNRPYTWPLRKLSRDELDSLISPLPEYERAHIPTTETHCLPYCFPPFSCPGSTMVRLMEDRLARRAEEFGYERYRTMLEVGTGKEWEELMKKDDKLFTAVWGEIQSFLYVHDGYGETDYESRWTSGENWINGADLEDFDYYGT
ncbi:hypothetical protein BJ508DRAFT_311428 [Ascobolus immersus RN42]|uniref:Uncharacterized protein n=1 Tax=Ascobolus immersus RN42 TaxID=1160509 RepID=A0A3N4HQA7_ASCIM|nr:hypothetical protein BJ508DRAFT_311428 [Ascobolus immersus RN42]